MKISVSRASEYKKLPESTEELTEAAGNAVVDCISFFQANDVRIGPEGLYLLVDGKVHVFKIDINYARTLAEGEDCPVTFIPDETPVRDTSPVEPLIEPDEFAAALGAEPMDTADLDAQRRLVIEEVWANYDFGDSVVAEANGWEHNSPNQYSRVFFVENRNGPSIRRVFTVFFRPGCDEVADANWK